MEKICCIAHTLLFHMGAGPVTRAIFAIHLICKTPYCLHLISINKAKISVSILCIIALMKLTTLYKIMDGESKIVVPKQLK